MKLSLAENIRTFRKQRKMTQEKLAEALGVTVGAVYKWESGQSQPELNLVVEMADFFDTSVDVLLGYKMKNNSIDSSLALISAYCQTLDPLALTEAEKALAKYPNSFEVVYDCASVYLLYGASSRDRSQLLRAQQLFEQAKSLLPQNDNPQINEAIIASNQSLSWFLLGNSDKCLEIMKKNNVGGMFSAEIGFINAVYRNGPEETAFYLSEALADGVGILLTVIIGYVFMYRSRKDWKSAYQIINWGIELLNGLKISAKPGIIQKAHAELLVLLAYVQLKMQMKQQYSESLAAACTLAREFDATPNYSLNTIRFTENRDYSIAIDLFGASANDSINEIISLLDEEELTAQWKQLMKNS